MDKASVEMMILSLTTTTEGKVKRLVADYMCENFHLTPHDIRQLSFAIDWPFDNIDEGSAWFDSASISEPDRRKIGRTNATVHSSISGVR